MRPKAWSYGRAHGNTSALQAKQMLGDKVYELLQELKQSLTDMVDEIKLGNSTFLDVINKVNKTVGLTDNLRGKLFEYFIATVMYYDLHLEFEVGKLITDPITYEKAELDIVMYNTPRAIHIFECKAYSSDISGDDIQIFMKKVRRTNNYLKNNELFKNADIRYYYFTLSDFTPEAITMLSSINKISIETKNKQQIRDLIKQHKEKDLTKTFEEYFL